MEGKISMKAKSWGQLKQHDLKCLLAALAACLALVFALVALLNYMVDPYGAFGDRVLQWWSYDETMNPRTAKIRYLEQHHDEYDSYIIGSSGSSSYPVDALNEYLGARFYNCFSCDSDMRANEELCSYLIENYGVKNILLNLSPEVALSHGVGNVSRTTCQYYKVSGENPLLYYFRFLTANPKDSIAKLQRLSSDGYAQQEYCAFDAETGAYDKSRHDVEPIGDLESYLARDAYTAFLDYPQGAETMDALREAMDGVSRIVQKCEENGVNLIVISQPCYYKAIENYSEADLADFRNALAEITDYWDFSFSSVSYEPRYFYEDTNFRSGVGHMALAKICNDPSVYVPDDFGEHISRGATPGAPKATAKNAEEYTARVPILLYHNVTAACEASGATITAVRFDEQMKALFEAGYTAVSFDDLRSYVTKGDALPEKPVVITFDDGYKSNYQLAFPVLEKYGMKATIYAIGVSVGKRTYKDTGIAIKPHFSLEQAAEMIDSGLITIANHGYNLHEVVDFDVEPIRNGAIQLPGETEAEYVQYLQNDYLLESQLAGIRTDIFAYPYGKHNEISELVLSECGVWTTVTTKKGTNTIIRGLENSLHLMNRFAVVDSQTGEDIIAMIEE